MNRFSGYSPRGNDKIGFLLTVFGRKEYGTGKGTTEFLISMRIWVFNVFHKYWEMTEAILVWNLNDLLIMIYDSFREMFLRHC